MDPAEELEQIMRELERHGVYVEPFGSPITFVTNGAMLPPDLLIRLRTLKAESGSVELGVEELRIEVLEPQEEDDAAHPPLVPCLFDGGKF